MARTNRTDPPVTSSRPPDEIEDLSARLHPSINRWRAVRRLEELFEAGTVPDPGPSGALTGRLVGTTTWGPLDATVQRVAGAWMPWLGKTLDPQARTGVNRFLPTTSTRFALKALFPSYAPERELPDHLDCFPFRTWVGPGRLDPTHEVLKIDYDFEANPALVRRILDELVQVGPGHYLGQALMRVAQRHHRVAYFTLRG
jgi:hypothetical protein